jgi:hypothetical protein
MWIAFLEWLAGWILKYLLGRTEKVLKDAASDLARDKEREIVNDANVKKYEEHKDRQDRIKNALDLLNRNSP